jgi:outer membrane protein OmpA-like peptidoglycan-associated protein
MACRIRSSRTGGSLTLLTAAVAALSFAGPAAAQTRGYFSADPNVTIDLSVLGGPGNEPVVTTPYGGAALPGVGRTDFERTPDGLLFPPPAAPASRLRGAYATITPPVLRRPTASGESAAPAAPQSRLTATPLPAEPMPKVASTAPMPAMPETAMPKPAMPEPAMPKPPVAAAAPPAATPVPAPVQSAARSPAPPPSTAVPPPPSLPAPTATPAAPAPPAVPAAKEEMSSAVTASAPAPAQTAARPPAASSTAIPADDATVRVLFDKDSAKLPDSARDTLLGLVGKLEANPELRLQIEAYAAGTSETASQARRLSLSRALSVRSYLIEQGVRSTRMDVRALGNKSSEPPAPADRVDAKLVER